MDKPATWVLFRTKATQWVSLSVPLPQTPLCQTLGDEKRLAQGLLSSLPTVLPGLVQGKPSSTTCGEERSPFALWDGAWVWPRWASRNCSLMCSGFLTNVKKSSLVKLVLLVSTYLWQSLGAARQESINVATAGASTETDGITSSPWKKSSLIFFLGLQGRLWHPI